MRLLKEVMIVKVIEINAGNIGSTGNIMLGIADIAKAAGHEVLVCFPDARDNRKKMVKNQLFISDRLSRNLHLKCAELTGLNGYFSQLATKKFLKAVDEYKPDIIHLPTYITATSILRCCSATLRNTISL